MKKYLKKWEWVIPCVLLLITYPGVAQYSNVLYVKKDTTIKDDVSRVYDIVVKAKSIGAKRIMFEKGTYNFYDDKAFEKFCFISNHDNGPRKTAFPILSFNNLEIDGNGSLFKFHGQIIPFIIENSSNIKIKNLSIDWDRTFHSEMLVVATDTLNRSIDLRISPDYPYQIQDEKLVFIRKNYEHSIETGIYWDPKTQAVAYNASNYSPIKPFKGTYVTYNPAPETLLYEPFVVNRNNNEMPLVTKAMQLEPGLVRLSNLKENLPKVGWIYVCKGYNTKNRLVPGIRVLSCENMSFENVNVHHAGGMGLIVEKSKNIHLNGFNVKRSDRHNRMLTTTADATHFVGC
ncbi:MAG: hypothetical protein WKF91_11175, partial [Segetibacter sp.]